MVERLGRYVLITKADMDRAERFLAGRGAWAIPLGRMLPLVRSFTSVVAGFTGVPALRFGILSAIGTVIYASVVASIGYGVGSAWHTVERYMAFASYLIAAVVIAAIVFFVIRRLRELRREAQAPTAAEDPVSPRGPRG